MYKEGRPSELEPNILQEDPREPNGNPDINSEDLAKVVVKNTSYYLPEFEKLKEGLPAKFNWAAFFFGLVFCLYRRCGELIKRYFVPPLVAYIIPIIILTYGATSFHLTLIMIGACMTVVIQIWMLVNCIRFGKHFNRDYYVHCQNVLSQGNEKQYGTSTKAVLLFYGILLAASIQATVSGVLISDSFSQSDYNESTPSFSKSQIVANEPPVEPITEPPTQSAPATKPNTSAQTASHGYYTYQNECKEYSLDIPEMFYPDKSSIPENGDGYTFYDSTGNSNALITVWGAFNVTGETGESYRDEYGAGVQYTYASQNLYVESDYVDAENIYYEATLFTDEKIVSFTIVYPAGSSTYYDGVIDHMMESLQKNMN